MTPFGSLQHPWCLCENHILNEQMLHMPSLICVAIHLSLVATRTLK